MRIKLFQILIYTLGVVSCNDTAKNNTPEIAIYLTANRVESNQGEIAHDSIQKKDKLDRFDFDIVRIERETNDIIFAGAFKASMSDLAAEPFINNEEVISFDKNTGRLILDSIAAKKLSCLELNSYGQQFVLTVDNEPELCGYFYPSIYYYCHTYHYLYLSSSRIDELELYFGKELRKVDIKNELPKLYEKLNAN